MSVRPAKTQISLGIHPVWSESSLCAQWVAKDPSFLHADSEDWSDRANAQADLSLHWQYNHFVGFLMSWLKSVQTSLLNNMIAILFIAVPIVEIKQMLVGKDCPLVKGKKVPVYVNFFKKKENPN